MSISYRHTGVFLDSTTEFVVNAQPISPTGAGKVKTTVTNPQGAKSDAPVKNNNDGTYTSTYTPFQPGIDCYIK